MEDNKKSSQVVGATSEERVFFCVNNYFHAWVESEKLMDVLLG